MWQSENWSWARDLIENRSPDQDEAETTGLSIDMTHIVNHYRIATGPYRTESVEFLTRLSTQTKPRRDPKIGLETETVMRRLSLGLITEQR